MKRLTEWTLAWSRNVAYTAMKAELQTGVSKQYLDDLIMKNFDKMEDIERLVRCYQFKVTELYSLN